MRISVRLLYLKSPCDSVYEFENAVVTVGAVWVKVTDHIKGKGARVVHFPTSQIRCITEIGDSTS